MTRQVLSVVGWLASVAGTVLGQSEPVLQRAEVGIEVSPISVARAVWGPDGVERAGEWQAYGGPGQRGDRSMVFDCIKQTGSCDPGMWFFGSGYCNTFVTNDMTVEDDTILEAGTSRAEIAWFWTAGGSFTSEYCIIGIFTQESVPCDPDSFDYNGWLIDFGTLPSSVGGGGYYFANIDLDGVGDWPLPTTGTGSYVELFLQEVTSSGGWVPATCAQPMLWGTGDARGDPCAPGTQGPAGFDGGSDDWHHSSEDCVSYSDSGMCPSVVGAAMGFWGYRETDCFDSFANCNCDGAIDTSDFLCFLGAWSAAFQSGEYDAAVDCNGDDAIDSLDFLCFLGEWVACR